MKIALAGNPNSGKTTLFNSITGKTEYVGNWPGVTVEKKEAFLKSKYQKPDTDVRIVDLPGAYSIAPYTGEEAITRDFVTGENPDVIINIIDASSLERSLFFTTQLLELGIPVVIALNKQDILKRHGDAIDSNKLANLLNCSVVETVANKEKGIKRLIEVAIETAGLKSIQTPPELDFKVESEEDNARQKFISVIAQECHVSNRDTNEISLSDRLDRFVAHKWLGLPIFFLVMWAVYAFSIEGVGGFLSGYLNEYVFGEIVPDVANAFFEGVGINPLLQSLIVDGAIGGVGAVVGFLPLIMVLFFCLGLLEDSGYMSRVAVVMDRFFKKIGLSGKSIIPMIVGSGCAIPGVMATRTIEDINEKRMTTILTPFVPCGAKIPIIALFSAVFFPNASWVGPSMYLLAIVMIAIGGLLLKKIFVWENTSIFLIELPEYKIPSVRHATMQMLKHAKGFIIKASTIILVMNTLVWFMQAYGWNLRPVAMQDASILASFGGIISPLLIPLGFVGWQLAAAILTGFVAKENVVATFAVLLAVASEDALHLPGGVLAGIFNPVTGYAFLAFNLFTPPCFAAIGAMNSELGSKKWLFRAIGFQLGVGYVVAMIISQIGSIIVYGETAIGFGYSIVVLVSIVFLVIRLIHKSDSNVKQVLTEAREGGV